MLINGSKNNAQNATVFVEGQRHFKQDLLTSIPGGPNEPEIYCKKYRSLN